MSLLLSCGHAKSFTGASALATGTAWAELSANVCCRGPEIEHCIGDEGTNPAADNDWSLLPFMALSDGAHLYATQSFLRALHGMLGFLGESAWLQWPHPAIGSIALTRWNFVWL